MFDSFSWPKNLFSIVLGGMGEIPDDLPVFPRRVYPATTSKRTVAMDRRAAKKRKAVKRARRLGHA